MKGNNNTKLIYERKYDCKLYENARMKHDDGSHRCMREEDKKIEALHKMI